MVNACDLHAAAMLHSLTFVFVSRWLARIEKSRPHIQVRAPGPGPPADRQRDSTEARLGIDGPGVALSALCHGLIADESPAGRPASRGRMCRTQLEPIC